MYEAEVQRTQTHQKRDFSGSHDAGNAALQAYYLQAPFAIERAPTVSVRGIRRTAANGVSIVQLADYPVRGLVFEANGSLAALAALVGGACQRLAAANVPHNLFIADCGARVFLLPNAFAERKVSLLGPWVRVGLG